ncbi:hypothetical protein LOZ52_001458 [Ophidiomyces ophidiicola]|uniref:uncharacterized protein n=1 Tax=Ophidiomyces ophidiicola TaxID=1387563 RepID=UPI0020C2DB88|nr:uncharacterized protein LOZ57_002025 [Ophidiomyces ophidiicola]KAI1950466.1 hypothetical protein LOZ57_002025 [Ophidiomyces ophidiicola]KAI2058542.1 hypothetical protein LOZ44_000909 [Ophidiomyces ophidiicola]KAI2135617.1 hypothetical protein LOZ28_004536 [Ophidiomyces ophidiicola]KAI2139954.1 hypothetical protein LOZ29_002249 [Ophidiomyces ophidiicola]KAI2169326.1 hypothetical protein LOZ23_001524 [Ophidiomyces ophidiicola]
MKPIIAVPATALLVYRAWSRKSLTPTGIVFATITAIVHALYPSPAPFACLVVFFLGGTTVTKVKHSIKAKLTVAASGAAGGDGPRTHVQVLANSAVASVLILLYTLQLYRKQQSSPSCFAYGEDLLTVGIVANYAAVAADTYSSELGILSNSSPRLITSLRLRKVPRGTNGGVTLTGLAAGALGASTIAITSLLLLSFCPLGPLPGFSTTGLDGGRAWGAREKSLWVLAVTIWGTLGSLLDSILGGMLQATVVDKRTGKVIEGVGGRKVLVYSGVVKPVGFDNKTVLQGSKPRGAENLGSATTLRKFKREVADEPIGHSDVTQESRKIETGHDILDNNAINVLMAAIMSFGAIILAAYIWDMPVTNILL